MLNLFRSNNLLSIAALLLFTFLIRLAPAFVDIPEQINTQTPLSELFFQWLSRNPSLMKNSYLLASLLVFLQAWLLSYTCSVHQVQYKDTLLPALFYVVLNSMYAQQLILYPQLIANTFLILLLFRVCYLYESRNPLLLVFDCGFLLGIALLFHYDTLIYLPFILFAVVAMTSFNVRYFLVSLFGVLLPLYFVAVLFYLNDQLDEMMVSFEYSLKKSYFHPIDFNINEQWPWLVIMPVFLFSFFHLQSNFFRNKVKTRRIQLVVGLLLLFGICSLFAENYTFVYGMVFLATALGIELSTYFISHKRMLFKEFLFLSLIASLVYNHYFIH